MKTRTILLLLGWLTVVLSLANGSAVAQTAGSLPVENVPNQPFQALVTVTVQADNNVGAAQLPLPDGKRLVIEQVTAAGTVPLPATIGLYHRNQAQACGGHSLAGQPAA